MKDVYDSETEFENEIATIRAQAKRNKKDKIESDMQLYVLAKSARVGATITCPACGKTFRKKSKRHTFCNPKCGKGFGRTDFAKGGKRLAKNVMLLRQKTMEELEALRERTKEIPVGSIFQCIYCGAYMVKSSVGQCFCPHVHKKCRERFRQLLRDRRSS